MVEWSLSHEKSNAGTTHQRWGLERPRHLTASRREALDSRGAAPLVVLLISNVFFSLDPLKEESCVPFGTDLHDLYLGSIVGTVEKFKDCLHFLS